MAPLFAAIAHGCAAGRHDEAFNEVYWPRIARGNEKFAAQKLGLYGSDLAAIAHFFAEPFAVPAPELSPLIRPWCSTWRAHPCARSGASPRRWSRCGLRSNQHVAQTNWERAGGESPPTSPSCW